MKTRKRIKLLKADNETLKEAVYILLSEMRSQQYDDKTRYMPSNATMLKLLNKLM